MDYLFNLNRGEKRGLQSQLRDQISAAILEGRIAADSPMPSSRRLSDQLGIARNTVMLAYESLKEDGFLVSKERSGYYVNGHLNEQKVPAPKKTIPIEETINWAERLTLNARAQRNIKKPTNWHEFKYCFVYGQLDPKLFPVKHWRECWRDAVGVQEITDWSRDLIDRDDPLLVDQIRSRLLTRRGLWVDESQILVTVGAQNALYMALRLLLNRERRFGIENPGYPDARNIAQIFSDNISDLAVDEKGLVPGANLSMCDVVYTTPSHQSPTTVTMPADRRDQLLALAERDDFIILEDDYEAETNFSSKPLPALMSYDKWGRVVYIGSLSKTLAPGLRLGYVVGPKTFIKEARALRRLIMRHPPANNQRAAAYFLSRGHHESLLRALVNSNKQKRSILLEALKTHLPNWRITPNLGGSSFWIAGPENLNTRELAAACAEESLLIEPGEVHYFSDDRPANCLRLGYTSIPPEKIEDGIALLAKIATK